MPRVKFGVGEGEPQDTEGNALRAGKVEAGENEIDTGGNATRGRVLDASEPESDDTEGNGLSARG